MHLTRLRIRHFRNLGRQDLSFPPEGVAIVGENAQGKSNLLEAIYYLETFRSFRGARDDQLVAFDAEAFHVAAALSGEGAGDAREVTAAFQVRGRRKKVTVDGAEADRLGDALGRLAAVIFSPADVALVSEGPAERRRFLDIVLSLNEAGYLEALQRFRQVLSQRNAALRDDQPEAAVRVWDEPLVRSGGRVTRSRAIWVRRWSETFSAFYADVSGGTPARMRYAPSVILAPEVRAAGRGAPGATVEEGPTGETAPPETLEDYAECYRRSLAASGDRERRTGTTVVGPHRDELRFSLEGDQAELDVREFGSGGQRRTAALALRLTEAETIREARGQEPIILMDDVFAELDERRSERVLRLIDREETGQVILAAPKEGDVRIRRETLPRWHIHHGRVRTP